MNGVWQKGYRASSRPFRIIQGKCEVLSAEIPLTHGTRACYQNGCRLTICRAAEATYRSQLRRLHAHGKQPLGARISPSEARKRIMQLKAERMSGRAVNRLSGLKSHALVVHSAITVRKLLRIRRIYRLYMTGEGPDQPLHASE